MANITELRDKCVRKLVKRARRQCFMDDALARCAFKGFNAGAELLIRAALGRDDMHVVETTTQYEMVTDGYKSLTIDIFARDAKGTHFNIEIQRARGEAPPERAMFHMAKMTSHILPPGEKDFKALPMIYVIFFDAHDELHNGLPLSSFTWYDTKNSRKLSDKQCIIYINSKVPQDDPLLASVVHDLFCKDYKEMQNKVLADKMKYLKVDKEGIKQMFDYFDDDIKEAFDKIVELERDEAKEEGKAEGEAKGIAEGKAAGARAMLSDNMPHELVVKYTGLTMEQVEALSKELATA